MIKGAVGSLIVTAAVVAGIAASSASTMPHTAGTAFSGKGFTTVIPSGLSKQALVKETGATPVANFASSSGNEALFVYTYAYIAPSSLAAQLLKDAKNNHQTDVSKVVPGTLDGASADVVSYKDSSGNNTEEIFVDHSGIRYGILFAVSGSSSFSAHVADLTGVLSAWKWTS